MKVSCMVLVDINKYYFVTSNENKLKEAREILGINIESINLDISEIQAINVKDVVVEKAISAYEKIKKPVIVEDTGLYFSALNDFPGALIRWMLKTMKNEGICELLNGFEDRQAYAETCICVYDGVKPLIFSGRVDGKIVESPRGSEGFGWDSIFSPVGQNKTFSEMSLEEKNKFSMRKIAFAQMKRYLLREK